jgi:hypothetical protein
MLTFSTGTSGLVRKKLPLLLLLPCLLLSFAIFSATAFAQAAATLRGKVTDPTGALLPGADVSLTAGPTALHAVSGTDGVYVFHQVPPGSYTLSVASPGFAPFSGAAVVLAAGHTSELNVPLAIAADQQNVTVNSQTTGVSLNADENAGSVVLKGSDLDALSDDPDELQNELQALAGPAAGPNGGQIYIDGFSGGQIPPSPPSARFASTRIPFPRSSTASATAASRSSPSPAPANSPATSPRSERIQA